MKALVTGATGFLGMAICKHLLTNGYSLRCQYRSQSKLRVLQSDLKQVGNIRGKEASSTSNTPTIEYVQQDLITVSQSVIQSMLKDCSVVVHNAASVKDYGSRRVAHATNVTTTEKLFSEAANLNISRFIYISSIAVHGLQSAEQITEDGPYNRLYNIYAQTKYRAEQAIKTIADQTQYRNYVIIRPGSIYGTEDHTTYYKIFDAIANKQLPYAGTKHGTIPLIHKDDVARAILCALNADSAIGGQAFNIVSDEQVEFKELFDYIAKTLSVSPPSFVVPRFIAFATCIIVMLIRKIPCVNFEPITIFRVRSMMSKRVFNTTKLKKMLHFTPQRNWRDGFKESITQYLDDKLSQ